MFVCKLRTPTRANYEHVHVYPAYMRQTGTVVTRQTYDRAPRLTRPPTAHISMGERDINTKHCLVIFIIITVRILRCYRFLTDGVILTLTDGC